MTGADAFFLHAEAEGVPLHTLKVLVLESAPAPVTLVSLAAAVGAYAGVVPRATQRVVSAGRGLGARPFWVDDPEFRAEDHLDEWFATGRGDRAELDTICARLAELPLDRDRPLWAMTLVHGLEHDRQAVVVRVHHALTDGLGALNTLLAVTTATRGTVADPVPAPTARLAGRAELRREVARDVVRRTRQLPDLVGLARTGRRAVAGTDAAGVVPSGLTPRSSFNARGGGDRVCASADLDLADLQAVGRATGATLNGVLHAVVAGAMREELISRGEPVEAPAVATFGVAADTSSPRRGGNDVAPAFAYLHTEIADPVERLLATARSCLVAVDLRRRRGFELTDRAFTYAPRVPGVLRSVLATVTDATINHITTANVPGPRSTRWLGEVEVVDWISYAVALDPANVNLTAYSYSGRLSLGLVATPEAMPDPARFLARLRPALDELVALTRETTHV